MTDEWILSVADVADALHCSLDDVRDFVAAGELAVCDDDPIRVRHDDLRNFVRERQRAALALGLSPDVNPDVLSSRPHVEHRHDEF